MPQTRKSSKGGNRLSNTTGRFLSWPSACGSGASAMSPSFMAGYQPLYIPVHYHRRLLPTGWRIIGTSPGVRHPEEARRPAIVHWREVGKARPTEPSRHQNELSMQPLSFLLIYRIFPITATASTFNVQRLFTPPPLIPCHEYSRECGRSWSTTRCPFVTCSPLKSEQAISCDSRRKPRG
jgi:hypothetical protein